MPEYKNEPCRIWLGENWLDGKLIHYTVSYDYNGGMVVDDKWYQGYKVPSPIIPKGYALVSIGVGLQMNAKPPFATAYLKPLENQSRSHIKADFNKK